MRAFNLPLKVKEIMSGFSKPWCIAGGWAIDLAAGNKIREHKDIEIAVFRRDQLSLQNFLQGWEFKKCIPSPGGLMHDWLDGEFLEPPIHEIHAFNSESELKEIEIMLNESDDLAWFYRRNHHVTFEISKLIIKSDECIPYLHPAVNLLYKSKNTNENDEHDFKNIVSKLNAEERIWLRKSIAEDYPNHKWLNKLK
jgi:hypothetical protein